MLKTNKYSNSFVVRKKNSERNKKLYPPSPSLQVKWSVPYERWITVFNLLFI